MRLFLNQCKVSRNCAGAKLLRFADSIPVWTLHVTERTRRSRLIESLIAVRLSRDENTGHPTYGHSIRIATADREGFGNRKTNFLTGHSGYLGFCGLSSKAIRFFYWRSPNSH